MALAFITAGLGAASATPNRPTLALQPGIGLSITGSTGVLYSIEYTTNVSQPNWRTLALVTLSSTSALVPGTAPVAAGSRFYRAKSVTVTQTNMVYMSQGTFLMGSPTNEFERFLDEGPQTTVTLSSGFFIGKNLVTQQQYQSVVGSNPSFFRGNPSLPVEQVSWQDATNYCAILTQLDLAAARIPVGYAYRLPTEAEWEYACRAGTTNRFYFGDDPDYSVIDGYGWFADNAGSTTRAVGQKPPNPWGLNDMCGNLWEWCQDWYGPYPGGSAVNPQGATSGSSRILRGGSWTDDGRFCRSAMRIGDVPGANFYSYYGFRVVLAPAQ